MQSRGSCMTDLSPAASFIFDVVLTILYFALSCAEHGSQPLASRSEPTPHENHPYTHSNETL